MTALSMKELIDELPANVDEGEERDTVGSQEPQHPEIAVDNDVVRMGNEAIAALAQESDVYQRSGRLVHVVRSTGDPGAVVRCAGSPAIKVMERPTLYERLASSATWIKVDSRGQSYPASVPQSVVSAVLARGQWSGVRPLVGIIEAPAMRPDGSVIQCPGYDETTGYLYLPNATYCPVPDAPSIDDAKRAAAALLEIVADFPFASDAHRAAWLALALTTFARPAIAGCVPLAAIDATTRGTGKGKLCDATANLVTGRDASKTPQPKDDDEMRKRITSLVIEGEAIAVIDNITRPVGDASLDAAVTATVWKDRALGKNETLSAPNRIVWIVTGNNLQFVGDTARRALHVRLESPLENPEDRDDFRHPDLLAWVRSERPRLVSAALTILRAYFVAGCPEQGVRQWGSFEAWARLIANALVWAGFPDPQSTRIELQETGDVERSALAGLLSGWARLTADAPAGVTAKDAIATLYPPQRRSDEPQPPDGFDELRDAIEALCAPAPGKPPRAQGLGYKLRQYRRRVIGNRMLECRKDRNGVARWLVLTAGDAGDAGDVSNPSRETSGKEIREQNIPRIPCITSSSVAA